jgi:hypothetical protein
MTFPPGPPAGRSLPTWHGKEKETRGTASGHRSSQKKRKGTLKTIKKLLHVSFLPRYDTPTISPPQLSSEDNKISSSSSTSNRPNEAPFRLLNLPRELRDRIYDFMIYDPGTDPCDKFQPPYLKDFATRPLFYNLKYNACLLATSHQIQREFAQNLCLRKERSAVPAVITPLYEMVPYQGRGPYYYKNYLPIPVNVNHLKFFSPFVQFLRSVEVRMEYSPLPGRTQWDPEVTIPDDIQINLTQPLIAALKGGKNLRSVRIRLYLSGGKFELGWVSREMERFKVIPGFELVQLDVLQVLHRSCSLTHTLWVLPRANGEVGWKHTSDDIDFFYSWRGPHTSGHDVQCFECWRQVQQEGGEEFPGFSKEGQEKESYLKLKKLSAPEFTRDDWIKWKMPER